MAAPRSAIWRRMSLIRRADLGSRPTVGLDPKSARLIKDVLRQLADRGSAVLITTHILEIAERMCDRIGIIDRGRLIAIGTMNELRRASGVDGALEDTFLTLTREQHEEVRATP